MDAAAALAARAQRRRGIVTLDDVKDLGIPERTFREWVAAGLYIKLQPRVYLAAAAVDGLDVRRLAAVVSAGDGAALSHMSAAHHYGLDGSFQPNRIDLTAPRRRRGLHSVVWHNESYDPASLTEYMRMPVTDAVATVVAVAALGLPYPEFRRVATDVVRRRLATERDLRLARLARNGSPGVRQLDRFLDEFSPLLASTRNEFEAEFVRVTTRAGVPPTHVNYRVADFETRARYIDAVYLPERVPVELDGRAHRSLLLDRLDDRLRERSVVLVGWRPFLRFSFWDLKRVPDLVVVEIRTALESARLALA